MCAVGRASTPGTDPEPPPGLGPRQPSPPVARPALPPLVTDGSRRRALPSQEPGRRAPGGLYAFKKGPRRAWHLWARVGPGSWCVCTCVWTGTHGPSGCGLPPDPRPAAVAVLGLRDVAKWARSAGRWAVLGWVLFRAPRAFSSRWLVAPSRCDLGLHTGGGGGLPAAPCGGLCAGLRQKGPRAALVRPLEPRGFRQTPAPRRAGPLGVSVWAPGRRQREDGARAPPVAPGTGAGRTRSQTSREGGWLRGPRPGPVRPRG